MYDDYNVRDALMGLTESFIEVAVVVFAKEDFPYNKFGIDYELSGNDIANLLESDDILLTQFAVTEASVDELVAIGFPEIAENLQAHPVSTGYNAIELGMVYDEPSHKAIVFGLLS